MIFQTQAQQARTCRAVLPPKWRWLFAGDYPSDEMIEYAERGGPMATSERLLIRIALTLWNGNRKTSPTIAEIVGTLDETNLGRVAAILTLLAQPNPHKLDAWLDTQDV